MLVAILAPLLTPYDPIKQDLENALQSPSAAHLLGTDKYGRDVLTRLLYGARVDLRVGFLAVLIPFVIGSVLGSLAGYFGGWFDTVVMRIVDVFFAFPFYVLVIVLVFVLGAGERSIYLAIARGLVGLLRQDHARRTAGGEEAGVRRGRPPRRHVARAHPAAAHRPERDVAGA